MINLKKIWWLNLKKCSKVNRHVLAQRTFLNLLILGLMEVGTAHSAHAFVKTTAAQLDQQIQRNASAGFEHLIQEWETQYGTEAVLPLLSIAKDRKKAETKRYIALMGAAKLGGSPILAEIQSFLKDSSWMLRSAALRLIATVGNPEAGKSVFPLLHDPALVVRAEAVETVRILKPEGAAEVLLGTLEDPENYHHGKALWVPQKALQALVDLKAYETAPRLSLFLESKTLRKDPELRFLARKTLALLSAQATKSTP